MGFGSSQQPETGIGVKKANIREMLSKEEFERRVMDIVHSKRDIAWWAENFFHIITLDQGLTKIKLYPKQKEMLQFIVENSRILTLASRQVGKTTTYTIFCLWYATLFQDKKIMICANKLQTAIEIMDRIRKAYEYLPFYIKPGILTYNKGEIEFANGSVIRATSTSSSASRGSSCNCVVGDTKVTVKDDFGNVFNCNIADVEKLLVQQLEVLTDSGWKKFTGVRISETTELYQLTFSNGSKLKCTPEHLIKTADLHFTKACELKINDKIFSTPPLLLVDIQHIDLSTPEKVYDLTNVEDCHDYRTNSVTSHNCLMIDEMAFIPKNIIDDFWASVIPIVSSSKNSKIIAVSTPNGASGLYYDLWQQANSKDIGKNKEGWKPFRIHWWEASGSRDEEWKQQQIATIGLERWKQEFECDFLTSATKKLIPDDIREKYIQLLTEYKAKGLLAGKKCKIMSEQEDKLYEFTMWHEFDKTHTYVASGDIAEGVGGDASVLYVWDISDLRNITMCAKFSSNIVSVVEFAFIVSKILALYGNPYFIAERNGISGGTLDSLRITYKYPRMTSEGKSGEPGVFSHVSVKGKACIWAREMLMTQGFGFTIYDKDLLDEWTTFVKKDTKGVFMVYKAVSGSHDDHIMAFIWLCYILQSDIIEKYYWVGSTFKSAYGNVYAQIVKPQKEYTIEEVKAATNDPIYKDFLDFKEELLNKLGHALEIEKASADKPDMYGFRQQDRYFGGYDFEPSWNGPQFEIPTQQELNPNNVAPTFFIGGGGGFGF